MYGQDNFYHHQQQQKNGFFPTFHYWKDHHYLKEIKKKRGGGRRRDGGRSLHWVILERPLFFMFFMSHVLSVVEILKLRKKVTIFTNSWFWKWKDTDYIDSYGASTNSAFFYLLLTSTLPSPTLLHPVTVFTRVTHQSAWTFIFHILAWVVMPTIWQKFVTLWKPQSNQVKHLNSVKEVRTFYSFHEWLVLQQDVVCN